MISIDAKNLEYAQRRLGGAPKQIEQAAARNQLYNYKDKNADF